MILGTGNDLIDIRRIEKTIDKFQDRFLLRTFTDVERAKAERRRGVKKVWVSTYAKRFAAKEACSKALGTGFRRGVYMKDLEVVNLMSGQPTMRLHGGALKRLKEMTPKKHTPVIHLSMTDDWPWAMANVIIEALPS